MRNKLASLFIKLSKNINIIYIRGETQTNSKSEIWLTSALITKQALTEVKK